MARTDASATLVGYGAIGRSIFQRMGGTQGLRISHVVVRRANLAQVQSELGDAAQAVEAVPDGASLLLECAGHSALTEHVIPALARGVESAVLSVGALAEPGLVEQLADAADRGRTQVHLLAGAIGGIDAIASARWAGLESVTYTGRKPPTGWRGSVAESWVNLDQLNGPTTLLEASAREAARRFPKNANVAATVALAGLGLDATRVKLIADPAVTENIHEIHAVGAFGTLRVTMMGKPLADNPKTSALTVLSALRFLHNRTLSMTL